MKDLPPVSVVRALLLTARDLLPALGNLGNLLREQGRRDEAQALAESAHLGPGSPIVRELAEVRALLGGAGD